MRKTTRPTSCKESFIKSAIAGFVAMMTNRARLRQGTPFRADALFGEDIHPFFRTVQAEQGHACPTLLVRNWCCSRKAGDWCFPPQENVRKKKKKTRKRGRKNISFSADCKFRAKESRFPNQKVFVHSLSSAPFLRSVEASSSPKLVFALCLYIHVPWQAQPVPGDTSTILAVKNRLENGTLG